MTYCSYNIIKYIKILFFYNFKQIFQNYVIEQFRNLDIVQRTTENQLTSYTFLLLSDINIINIIFNIIKKENYL